MMRCHVPSTSSPSSTGSDQLRPGEAGDDMRRRVGVVVAMVLEGLEGRRQLHRHLLVVLQHLRVVLADDQRGRRVRHAQDEPAVRPCLRGDAVGDVERLDAALAADLDLLHASPSATGSASTDSNVLMNRAAAAPSSARWSTERVRSMTLRGVNERPVPARHGPCAADGQGQHVGRGDDRGEAVDRVHAQVGDGQAARTQVVGAERAAASPLGGGPDGLGHVGEVELLGVVDDRDEQTRPACRRAGPGRRCRAAPAGRRPSRGCTRDGAPAPARPRRR